MTVRITDLPPEVFQLCVLPELNAKEWRAFCSASRRCRELGSGDVAWEVQFRRAFGGVEPHKPQNLSWKELYAQRTSIASRTFSVIQGAFNKEFAKTTHSSWIKLPARALATTAIQIPALLLTQHFPKLDIISWKSSLLLFASNILTQLDHGRVNHDVKKASAFVLASVALVGLSSLREYTKVGVVNPLDCAFVIGCCTNLHFASFLTAALEEESRLPVTRVVTGLFRAAVEGSVSGACLMARRASIKAHHRLQSLWHSFTQML